MSVATWTRFFALLALAANLATALVVVAAIVDGGLRRRLRELVAGQTLRLAALVATVATAGSLYYSEVARFVPCTLCWYQRIAMYPLVVLFGLAAWRRDHGIRPYAAVLATVGAGIAAYHYLIQRFPSLDAGSCSLGVPCSTAYVLQFGFITIPYMAFSAFTALAALLWLDRASADPVPSPSTNQE